MLRVLNRLLTRVGEHPGTPPSLSVSQLVALADRVERIERNEALRAAEWADTLDRFERLYKRLCAREQRANAKTPPDDRSAVLSQPDAESPLQMRRRMRGL